MQTLPAKETALVMLQTTENLILAKALYAAGLTDREVGKRLGCCVTSAQQLRRAAGVKITPKAKKTTLRAELLRVGDALLGIASEDHVDKRTRVKLIELASSITLRGKK